MSLREIGDARRSSSGVDSSTTAGIVLSAGGARRSGRIRAHAPRKHRLVLDELSEHHRLHPA
ncbi:hypothetical protein ACFPM0_36820 [Pseudonocardia sulfidoxydans]|uniref:hypothetical protein n=1 Tax=Pseudonocardia sulfidoxydans TaxID=54011 RepID=UPI00360E1714